MDTSAPSSVYWVYRRVLSTGTLLHLARYYCTVFQNSSTVPLGSPRYLSNDWIVLYTGLSIHRLKKKLSCPTFRCFSVLYAYLPKSNSATSIELDRSEHVLGQDS